MPPGPFSARKSMVLWGRFFRSGVLQGGVRKQKSTANEHFTETFA